MKNFKFIDLFCGIGGFHQALSSLGGTCVFASDIDADCRKTYFNNYGIEPVGDIKAVDEKEIPAHDVLCGGFPCQSFSKAGKRKGFDDPTKGTLFFDIIRIIRFHKPKYVLLENVRNLASHDNGRTWKVVYNSLKDAGYNVSLEPVIFSPHWLGIPQHRERVFIMAIRNDLNRLPKFIFNPKNIKPCRIESVLQREDEVDEKYWLSKDDDLLIEHWNKFIQNIRTEDGTLPTFPVWTEYFREVSEKELLSVPKWKANFIRKNSDLYFTNQEFLDQWLEDAHKLKAFEGTKTKFEWQAGPTEERPNLHNCILQFRPSGLRVKTGNYFPALVAMVQKSIIGERVRYMTPRECARIQSFPDTFQPDENEAQAYKQFGNSVNVEVVKLFAEFLLDMNGTRKKYSEEEQYPEVNRLF